MIYAYWNISRTKQERSELIYARDLANEYLEHFGHYLEPAEREELNGLFKTIQQSL